MSRKLFVSLVVIGLLLTACGVPATFVPPTVVATPIPPTPTVPAVPTTVPTTEPTPSVEPTDSHIAVDLGPAQRAALQALAEKLGVGVDIASLVSTEAVDWPNGCLGVVRPGVLCTQNVVPGFRILFSVNGQKYEYHTNQDGTSLIAVENNTPFVSLAVQATDGSVQFVKLAPTTNLSLLPVDTALLPKGGNVAGTLYTLNYSGQVVAVTADGSTVLPYIQQPTYGLAVWAGDAGNGPKLAWGTQIDSNMETRLMVSAPDGSQMEVLLSETVTAPSNFVAQGWSADGQTLFFSREPSGIGGYIPFAGASSLYALNMQDKSVTEIVPFTQGGTFLCLDAMSTDKRFVADHCAKNVITVRDLSNGQTSTIQPPAEVNNFGLMGSARFSPDGQKVAFAMALGDPTAEQSWVAVSDSLSGASHLVLTGQPNQAISVAGWLSDSTLLLQVSPLNCANGCAPEVWQVNTDGSNLLKVADGSYVTLAAAS